MTLSVGSFTIELRNSSFYLKTPQHELFISKLTGVVHSRKGDATGTPSAA
jgi:hypothetical protein